MKVLVVGLGSMGKRRMRLMREFFPFCDCAGVDSRPDRRSEAEERFSAAAYDSLPAALEQFRPEAAFVCTSPLSHSGIIRQLLEAGVAVFTEINLLPEGYRENLQLAREKGLLLFLSSTPIYRAELRWVEQHLSEQQGPVWYRYHVGQYLPDWHPWENYKDFFVGDSRTGGVREIMAIELPWMQRAFSPVESFSAAGARLTGLAIGYQDALALTLRHQNGTVGSVVFDVVSRRAVKELEVFGEGTYVHWDGSPAGLTHYDPAAGETRSIRLYDRVDQDPRYASNIVENMYVDEMQAFFDRLAGREARVHTFEEDLRVIELMDAIEREAKGE